MQLKRKRKGSVSRTLSFVTANLFIATGVHAQESTEPLPASAPVTSAEFDDDTESDLGTIKIDSAVLFYKESGGRVQAIEPVIGVTVNSQNGNIWSAKLTVDSLTGASPNGATPWRQAQTFMNPIKGGERENGDDDDGGETRTGASGVTVVNPVNGLTVRQYTTPANILPLDSSFKDTRVALDLGFSTLLNPDLRLSLGVNGSNEYDYRSLSGSIGIAKDLNQKNTTLSLGANFAHDVSRPVFGSPIPLSIQDGTPGGPSKSKNVFSVVGGVTQVMSRRWLAQVNYSFGSSNGYHNDPYRILSVVDSVSGAPLLYRYENRPNSRTRHSIYIGNKIAIGPTVADISARVYRDSWGIKSLTAEISERFPVTSGVYLEPSARYYHQSAADFFKNYLVQGQMLPQFASSDYRLDKFNAVTYGLKAGMKIVANGEIYLQGEHYKQSGTKHPAGAIGDLANQNLFGGVKALSVVFGFRYTFR